MPEYKWVVGGRIKHGQISAIFERWHVREVITGGIIIGSDNPVKDKAELADTLPLIPTPVARNN